MSRLFPARAGGMQHRCFMRISCRHRRAIVRRHTCCYIEAMFRIAKPRARPLLPTSEGFAKLSDRARLPGRFFYRLVVAGGQ
ncbi:hypothetical protein [Aurantimonas aggregata]|uniref:hypothetical protein n=1 Tax=Aurantimonas aggregata TaxID=2047720 RepID=UPI0019425480|nr:hypothetical protein [Aurantimonas aggregata]